MSDRAVVAISEDRKWLVVLAPEPEGDDEWRWHLMQWDSHYREYGEDLGFIVDIGQRAEDVLAAFVAEREITDGSSSTP